MRIFDSQCFYNAQLRKWQEVYWIDGKATDADTYFYEQEKEKEIENMKLKNLEFENNPCETCEDDEFIYEDLLDIFVNKILETKGCPKLIGCVLDEFANVFLSDDEDELDCEELIGCTDFTPDIVINIGELYLSDDFDINKFVEQVSKGLKNLN